MATTMRHKGTQRVEQLLKSAKVRLTKPRIAVMGVLLASDKPVTQQAIAEKAGAEAPDKVTIYRILETFVKVGIVHKAFLRKRTWHYEPAHNCTEHQCHPHFTCTNCGRTVCLMQSSLPIAKVSEKGFVVHRQQVRLEGLCPGCA